MKSYLNLGCGSRFHPGWTNLDFESGGPGVVAHDLRRGIPFADGTFEAIYHSHVLEHFPRREAVPFLRECRRELRPGGVLRVVVPDLESVVRAYLDALERAERGEGDDDYEYVMLELYDQAVRERPGGEQADFLRRDPVPNYDFVLARGGTEARNIVEGARRANVGGQQATAAAPNGSLPRRAARFLRRTGFGREALLRFILGGDYESLRVGRFRRRGEPHLWMYDRHSILKVLREAGFQEPRLFGPAESQVPGWASFNLDTEPDGATYKPHSLYAEGRK